MVAAGMPASSWSCLAARAASEQPITRYPEASQAWRGGGEGEGLAGAGDAFDDLDAVARPADRPDHRLLLRRQRPRAATAASTARRRGDADAGGRRWSGGADDAGLDLEHLGCGPADLVGPGRDHHTVVAADGRRAAVHPDGEDVFGAKEPVDQVEDPVDAPPAGRALQMALMTSRSPNVLALAVSPSALASHR